MSRRPEVAFRAAARFWVLLGFINFGGPAGQIAIMHDELVDRRRWIDEERFLHALSFCMLLPGPEAHQLAIYIGWLLHGLRGGILAGVAFVAPAAVVMLGLAWAYAAHGEVGWVAGIFDGLSAAVVGIVAAATMTIASRTVRGRAATAIAITAFVSIWLIGIPFPVLLVAAALCGALVDPGRLGMTHVDADRVAGTPPPLRRTVRVAVMGLAVWWLPILLVAGLTGIGSVYVQEGVFYSQVAVITFGGAYAVLAYVGREVIARFGLGAGDVVAGLGLAETTPGPLILLLEFLGFLAAYRNPGTLPPALAGAIGAAVTVWATFVPSFVWIFVGAPYVERLRANVRLRGALGAITAAVVGVVASLALSVATVTLFAETTVANPFRADVVLPRIGSLQVLPSVVAALAFVAIRRFKVHVLVVVLGAAAVGFLGAALL